MFTAFWLIVVAAALMLTLIGVLLRRQLRPAAFSIESQAQAVEQTLHPSPSALDRVESLDPRIASPTTANWWQRQG